MNRADWNRNGVILRIKPAVKSVLILWLAIISYNNKDLREFRMFDDV